MSIIGGVIDGGFVSIAGFGVWRGQSLWSRHIELKHAREMERLGMDRMEKSIRLEMEQTRNLAEIDNMKEFPALTTGEQAFQPSDLPFVCGCGSRESWHLHVTKRGVNSILPLSVGAIAAIRDGKFHKLCVCTNGGGIVHAYDGGQNEPKVTLNRAGYEVRR